MIEKSWIIRLILPCSCALALSVGAASGEAADGPDEAADRSLELLEKAAQRSIEAEAVSVDVAFVMDMRAEGMRQEMESTYEVHLNRPNRFALLGRQGQFAETLVSDGETATSYYPMMQKYIEEEAPDSIESLLDEGGGMMGMSPVRGFVAPLLSKKAYEESLEMVESSEYLGGEERNGQTVHRISVRAGADMDDMAAELPDEMPIPGNMDSLILEFLLVEDENNDFTIERIDIDMTDFMRSFADMEDETGMAAMFREMEMTYSLRFSNWDFPEAIDSEKFTFTPPDGAEKIASTAELFDFDMPEREPHGLLGEKAPDFELEMLDGGEARLADHLGKDVIVLDFWATWCGPCVRAMPMLIDVTDEYRDQGVVFWAINQSEGEETVRRFLEDQEWDLKVPMDSVGEVGGKYKVAGIPQTVVIDREGIVQAVHIGFSPDLDETLAHELDVLLAGGSLLEETGDEEPAE